MTRGNSPVRETEDDDPRLTLDQNTVTRSFIHGQGAFVLRGTHDLW